MQVTPSGKRACPTALTPNAPDLESARFANRGTVLLPDEMVIRILMNLGTTDIAVCRRVNRQWQTLIDTHHLLARSFYRDCHLTQRINSLTVERNLAVELYHSHTRGWLTDFSNRGRETAKQLDKILEYKHFPEVLFFSIPKLLLNSNELTYQNTATIGHLGVVRDARFSPDGKYLVTVSDDNHAKLCELEGGQWREKVILRHSAWVKNASFSPDGNHLVTASGDGICKIWRLEDDQWQEKITIKHSECTIRSAQFSPDGKDLVIASRDGLVKIWKFDDGQWEEKFTIRQRFGVANARFSPDGKHLVMVNLGVSGVTSDGFIYCAKLWELVDDQSQEKATIQRWQKKATIEHSDIVNDAHFSPDGKHLVTASCDGFVKICGLIDGKWQTKVTTWHDKAVINASFSRDGKFVVTASRDGSVEIFGLIKGKWQLKATIWHCKAVTNARFGPTITKL